MKERKKEKKKEEKQNEKPIDQQTNDNCQIVKYLLKILFEVFTQMM